MTRDPWWTDEKLAFLKACAGEMPPREIADLIGCHEFALIKTAERLGIDVRYYERRTEYCVECGTYRLMDEDGECPVCRAKRRLERVAERYGEADRGIDRGGTDRPRKRKPRDASASEVLRVDDEHCMALQEWELQRIERERWRIKANHYNGIK